MTVSRKHYLFRVRTIAVSVLAVVATAAFVAVLLPSPTVQSSLPLAAVEEGSTLFVRASVKYQLVYYRSKADAWVADPDGNPVRVDHLEVTMVHSCCYPQEQRAAENVSSVAVRLVRKGIPTSDASVRARACMTLEGVRDCTDWVTVG